MLSLQIHLSQTTSELATVVMAAEAMELRSALMGVLLFGAVAFAALLKAACAVLSQAVQLLKDALRLLALAAVAGLVVAVVVILAFADLLAR
jgi:hypothetical protein